VTAIRTDKELEQFRNLMEVPSQFEEGFNWTSLAGALFIAMLMVPGAMYMNLLAGMGVGPAAQWVTVILFIEVARRAHKHLKRAEIFILFFMAGAIMQQQQFAGLLWNQFFVQSRASIGLGVADTIPHWYAPGDPEVLALRSFLHPAWYPAVGLIIFQTLLGRLNVTILSYGLFRIASDVEKLPFPMAPIGAQGILALAEQQTEESKRSRGQEDEGSWRWRVFSIGGILGLSFGLLYMALPTITGALFDEPITILPIPFTDWTPKTSKYLSAVATGMSLNLGQLIVGMVLPFYAMLGSFVGLMMQVVANPALHHFGLLPSWNTADDTIQTMFHNHIDFYFSFTIGIALAIAAAGIFQVFRSLRIRRKERRRKEELLGSAEEERVSPYRGVPPGRGDIRTPWILATYLFTSMSYILVSGWLIDWHPNVMVVLFFFAFLYQPFISYVTARLEGMAGQVMQIPFVREAAFILSGYSGDVKIWFLPVPIQNFGRRTVFYRQAELTGTKFWSIWKAELTLVPIVLLSSIFFAEFIWRLAEIPSANYPYAQKMWELGAAQQCIIFSSTLGRFSQFQEAFRPEYLAAGAGFGLLLFFVMWFLNLPIMLIYGTIRGLNNTLPHVVLPQFIGALIGKFYFQRKLGLKWREYIPVVAAGFACGMGLITVLAVGLNFLATAVIRIPF